MVDRRAMVMSVLVVTVIILTRETDSCPANTKFHVDLNVGFLIVNGDLSFQSAFDEFRALMDPIPRCVNFILANIDIWKDLKMSSDGWTNIKSQLIKHGRSNVVETHVVVGPYYMNLAMMLEQLNVTYLTIAHKGYNWTDMNRVDDPVRWRTMVELIPPPVEQNRAVVDLFHAKNWQNAIMIMPDEVNNEECKDLAHQMIDNKISLIPFSIPTNGSEAQIKMVLRNSKLLSQRQLIICSPRDEEDRLIHKVLSQAKKFNMFEKEDLAFMIVEPYSLLRSLSGINNTIDLGLFGVRCQLLTFRYIQPMVEQLDLHQATAADTARVLGKAVEEYALSSGGTQRDLTSSKLRSFIKKVNVYGDTGAISFDDMGRRVGYKLHLFRQGGERLYQKLGEWQSGNDDKTRIKFIEEEKVEKKDTDLGIFPKVVKVVVVEDAPFIMVKKYPNGKPYTGKRRFKGFTIDLLKQLSDSLHFNYEVEIAPNNSYGIQTEYDVWDGAVGEVVAGRATFAMGALSITSRREDAIDFTTGIMTTGSNMLIPKPAETLSIFQFLKPFSPTLWAAIMTAFFIICVTFFAMDYKKQSGKFTLKECLWFSLGTLLMRGTDFSPHSVPQRIMTSGFIFFSLIMVSTYTANMAAFLTTQNVNTPINSFADLVNDDSLVPLAVRDSSTMLYMKTSTDSTIQKLWNKIETSGGLVQDAMEAIQKVEAGGHALIFDYHVNNYAEQNFCHTMAVGVPVLRLEHGIGLPSVAPYKRLLDIAILRLQESGQINNLVKRWWHERRRCDRIGDLKKSNRAQFDHTHMAGIFIVGGVGIALSVFVFTFKQIYLTTKGGNSDGTVDENEGEDQN